MNILGGIVGAVIGFFAGIAFYAVGGFENKYDPIASGLTALFLFGPAGAIGGAFLGVKLVKTLRGQFGRKGAADGTESAAEQQITPAAVSVAGNVAASPSPVAPATGGSVAKDGLKAIGIVVALVVAGVSIYAIYAYETATPWLNPKGATVVMPFEIRLAPGAALPANPQDVKVDLWTDINQMHAELD